MPHHIIFLEGLPGSGKTVYSRRLSEDLTVNRPIKQYEEGALNPIDLGYLSVMSHAEYQTMLTRFSHMANDIENVSMQLGDVIITAFTKVKRPRFDDPFYEVFSSHQLINKADFKTFKRIYFALWQQFAQQHDKKTLYLYGGAFLQNHYEVLWLKYGLTQTQMRQYFKELITHIKPLNPLVVYIKQRNIQKTINRVAEKRKASQTGAFKDWFDMVIESLASMPLTKSKGYEHQDGAYRFYEDEQAFECSLLPTLPVKNIQLTLDEDYDEPYRSLLTYVNQHTTLNN